MEKTWFTRKRVLWIVGIALAFLVLLLLNWPVQKDLSAPLLFAWASNS